MNKFFIFSITFFVMLKLAFYFVRNAENGPAAIRACCNAVKWSPVIFISAIVIWSYYAYVVEMCIFTSDQIWEKVILLLLYHPVLFMFLWSYWQTIFTKSGRVPRDFYLPSGLAERLESEQNEEVQKEMLKQIVRNLPVQTRTISGFPRYCEKCKCIKPDRCHHCSVCATCVLKMDHHCPGKVNNCVGFTNYKFFVLFLGYGLLYCFYVAVSSLKFFIQFWTGGSARGMERFHVLFLFFVSVMFGISLISLFCYHLYLVCKNRSTLEAFRAPVFQTGPDKDGFNLGRASNFREVFGKDKTLWFLPVFSSLGDGVSFPSRLQPVVTYNTMGNTPSVGNGVTYPTRMVDNDNDGLLGARQRWMEEGGEENDAGSGFENKGMDMA
ncbi:palmitoyltransferase ZDHHC15B-like [Pomacea canaliculata]|uniref:palmitoyltransferase ZDHHC15B-like n=1 Tax=Pomacea canaliculata TaxID=400727 RepID=UPI000D735283|nr:palmitoyltransferase ZDHHC15B-like [Pomacea canaliculata]